MTPGDDAHATASGKASLRLGFVSSGGGHLTEALALAEAFQDTDRFVLTYDQGLRESSVRTYTIPQFYYRPWLLPWTILRVAVVLLRERPHALISTGAEPALLAFPLARLLGAKLIYIECGAQVFLPSWTGRLLYRLCDRFFIQWPALQTHYRRARCVGALIE